MYGRPAPPASVQAGDIGDQCQQEPNTPALGAGALGGYVVSEALTNAVKYSNASAVHIAADVTDDVLRLSMTDDGAGWPDPTHGSDWASFTTVSRPSAGY